MSKLTNFTYKKSDYNFLINLQIPLLRTLIRQSFYKSRFLLFQQIHNKKLLDKKINFELLTIFYRVILYGSISLASENLGMSQPAITLALQRLEKDIDCLLFRQTNITKSIKLTKQGVILFNYVERLFQIIEESSKFSNINFITTVINNSLFYRNFFLARSQFSLNSYQNLKLLTFQNFKDYQSVERFFFLEKANITFLKRKKTKKPFSNRLLFKLKKINSLQLNQITTLLYSNSQSTEVYSLTAFQIATKMKISNLFYIK